RGRLGGRNSMVTEEEWSGEVVRTNRLRWVSLFGGLLVVGAIFVPSIIVAEALTSGIAADLTAAGLMIAVLLPMSSGLIVLSARQQAKTDAKMFALNAELSEAIADA